MTTKNNKQTIEEYYIQEIHKWQSKLGRAVNLVENTKKEYLKVEAFAKECLVVAKADVDDAVKHKAVTYEILKNLKLERDKALKTVVPVPVKLENGKVICQYCGKEFSPQGIKGHKKKCKKAFDKEAEVAKLTAELEKLKKEELIPVVIPEVKEIPKPEPTLTLEEITKGLPLEELLEHPELEEIIDKEEIEGE